MKWFIRRSSWFFGPLQIISPKEHLRLCRLQTSLKSVFRQQIYLYILNSDCENIWLYHRIKQIKKQNTNWIWWSVRFWKVFPPSVCEEWVVEERFVYFDNVRKLVQQLLTTSCPALWQQNKTEVVSVLSVLYWWLKPVWRHASFGETSLGWSSRRGYLACWSLPHCFPRQVRLTRHPKTWFLFETHQRCINVLAPTNYSSHMEAAVYKPDNRCLL